MSDVKTQKQSLIPMKGLFNQSGWHLERSILEEKKVLSAVEFISSRRKYLQMLFREWVGTELDEMKSYSEHQQRLHIYETQKIPKDLRHFLTGEFDLETRLDSHITELLSTERCRNFICNFLQTDHYYIHYPPMIRFKVVNASSSMVPVHQDLAYNRHMLDFITIWVPLVDIDDECGGIIVYEDSHLADVVEHEVSGAWANRAVTDFSNYQSRHITMKAGDVLLFPPTLLHESAPHRSQKIRYSIDFRVFRYKTDTAKSYYDPFTKVVTRVD